MTNFKQKQNKIKNQIVHDVVFEAALKVLSGTDHSNLKIKDIAEEADISIGTIYNYFNSKEDVIYFLDGRFKELAVNVINQRARDDEPAHIRLEKMIQDFFSFCEKHYVIFDLTDRFRVVEKRPEAEKQQKISEALVGIKIILDDCVKEKIYNFDNTEAVARMLFFAMVGCLEVNSNIGIFKFSGITQQFIDDIWLLLNNNRNNKNQNN